MTVLNLAWRSLRFRSGSYVASFLSLFLGATIVMGFAAMLDTAGGDRVDAASEETLFNMGTIVGGWGLIIVAFAVASTLTLSVRQRATEIALLKSIGATPGQIGRMIVGEATVVAAVAAVAAIPLAAFGGWILLELLKDTGQVGAAVPYSFGSIALQMGFGVTVLGAVGAALLTVRRTNRMRAREAALAAAIESPRMGRKRTIAALVFLAIGLNCGIVTATVFHGKGIDAMQTGGQAAIWFSIGLALLAPALVRRVTAFLARPLRRLGGASGYLTAENVRQRSHQMAGALMPIILFTGIATGTLYMQSIENSAPTSGDSSTTSTEAQNIETLNFVVIGMIALFAAIMVVNTLVAATIHRRQEFGQQRLVGSTPPQVLQMVSLEGVVLALTGVFFGSVASIVTVVPYSIARTDSVLPDTTIGLWLGIAGTAAALTLATSLGAAQRAVRAPAVEAAAVA